MGNNWKNKIREQFSPTVPDDYEVEFDICMKCGRRLPDKKYSTLKEHQEKNHKLPRRLKFKEMVFKYPLIVFPVIVIVGLPLMMIFLPIAGEYTIQPILFLIYPELEQEQVVWKQCSEDIKTMKGQLFEVKEFNSAHTQEFNRLLTECNLNFFSYFTQPTVFENEINNPENFEEEEQ